MTLLNMIDLLDRNIGQTVLVTRLWDHVNEWKEENNENSTRLFKLWEKEGEYCLMALDVEATLDVERITHVAWFERGEDRVLHIICGY